jgi:hypothetical protein
MRIKTIYINKLGEDDYSYSIPEDHVADEEVNSVQLMGVMHGRTFIDTTPEDVLAQLDMLEIGKRITRQFQSPL